MTFEEWWDDRAYPYTDRDCAEDAYEAGVQEGINIWKAMIQAAQEHSPDCDMEKYSAFECPECTCKVQEEE